jgi:hypothetical protein
MGVGVGMSSSVFRSTTPSLALKNAEPSSASEAEDMTALMLEQRMWMAPFRRGGVESGVGATFGVAAEVLPKKKRPAARERDWLYYTF